MIAGGPGDVAAPLGGRGGAPSDDVAAHVDHLGRPRVAITGLGVKAPGGCDPRSLWSTLLAAAGTAAGPITLFDAADMPIPYACEVRDFDPLVYVGQKEIRRLDRFALLAFAAAVDALRDAGEPRADPARCAVTVGNGIGGLTTLEEQERNLVTRGPARVSPFLVPMLMPNAPAALIAMEMGWTGPNFCVSTACAAGSHAIGEGARLIREGSADLVLAGGTEAVITPIAISAFFRMGALSSRAEFGKASRPFDIDRDGFVLGEGAGYLVLEPWERAVARGARIYAELAGYGRNSDAYHVTAPSPGGAGAAACMQLALDDAGVAGDAVGHVNAHGTATPLNDASEAEAIRKVFGEPGPAVTSVKGVTGHLIGGAGAVEAVVTSLAVQEGLVPPTANHDCTDPALGLDVVAGEPRRVGR
ncbi:MAG: beta-ketoacyl-[acyl-carrier-protein] synthase family protein, partial [Acidimicrobiia bacterium]